MNAERLLKMADFLDALPPKKFYYAAVVNGAETPTLSVECGSTCCVIGWTPIVFPELVRYEPHAAHIGVASIATGISLYWNIGMEVFDVSEDHADFLFDPFASASVGGLRKLNENATSKEVAANLRAYVAEFSSASDSSGTTEGSGPTKEDGTHE